MSFFICITPPFILAILLFWQKRKLTTLIMFHISIVMILYARGIVLNPYSWTNNQLQNTQEFDYLWAVSQSFIGYYCFFWLYEWWYVGRRRSELKFE